MTPSRRSVTLGALALSGLAAARPAVAFSGDVFSVSGKTGPYLKQVAGQPLDSGGGVARGGGGLVRGGGPLVRGGGGGSLALASDAVNLGQYQAARLRMPETEAKVAALLARLDGQWPYAKSQGVTVEILGVDYFNAYSLPDYSIVVAFGLLDEAQSDDEVAFVLGHELGHLRLGHFHAPAPAAKETLTSRTSQAILVDAALRGAGGGAGSALADSAAKAGATNDLLHFLTGVSAEPGHTREQEDQADCIGYDLCLAAAFAADAASAKVFDSISADQQSRARFTDSLNAELKSELGRVLTPGAAASLLTGGGFSTGGLMMGAGRIAFAMAANRPPPPQHRPPEERKRGLAQYSADAYPQGAPLIDEKTVWLTSVRGSAEFTQAKVAVGGVADAQKARAAGDYATATAAIGRASQTRFANAPLVLNEAARLRDNMGDTAGADALFVRAHASPDQTVDGYLDHVRMLYRVQQNDRAMQIIQQGVATFNNDDKPFLSLLIAVSLQAGRPDDAKRYLGECLMVGDEALASDCRLAAGKKAEEKHRSPFGLPFVP
jgi:hypothetical protein